MALVERIGSLYSSFRALRPSASNDDQPASRPEGVGILAMEVYFPKWKVDQEALERHDGVATGKYTVGLGQVSMSFAGDNEDVVSMALTVVSQLLQKYSIRPEEVGRLEVGTESSIDRSKSIKSHLMDLFKTNPSIQGVDCISACYGATAALFNAINWVESRSWDGRYAIVVASDLAVYAQGPARPSGGCGAVAMLIGPNAPLVVDTQCCATTMDNAYDFYKPSGIYPQVDGKLSVDCYLKALAACYRSMKARKYRCRTDSQSSFSLNSFQFCIMHAPFGKMVRKGFSLLLASHSIEQLAASPDMPESEGRPGSMLTSVGANDSKLNGDSSNTSGGQIVVPKLEGQDAFQAVICRHFIESGRISVLDLTKQPAVVEACAPAFEKMVQPSLLLGSRCGNMYTASVWAGLASLVYSKANELSGCRILTYSYGSGLAASLFSIHAQEGHEQFTLSNIAQQLNLMERLSKVCTVSPEDYMAMLTRVEAVHDRAGFVPETSSKTFPQGTYFLSEVSEKYHRSYKKVL